MTAQPHLFDPAYAQPIDPSTQVARMPGTDAPCLCPTTGIERIDQECLWPFCDWKTHQPDPQPSKEDE